MSDARSAAVPASEPAAPAGPLIGPTGSPTLDCIADAINSTVAPFQNAPPAEQGAAGWISQGLGGVLGIVGAPQLIIDSAFAGLTAPLAAMLPSMPAITLLGLHIGSMHAHVHPPSLIPPAPPIPLPSIGTVLGAGAISVRAGGLPLARAGDVGISVTCGSFAPPFEIYTGSSNVFVGGARAARLFDLTKHCNPSSMGPFDIAMAAAGAVAGVAGAIATTSATAAAQAAAEAAVFVLKLLCGKDPGGPPGWGALLGPPVPNVLIGGFPCPPVGDMIFGALMKGLKRLVAAFKKLGSAIRGNGHCADASHPIYLVTGENFDSFTDFVSAGLFCWQRHYSTARAEFPGPLGHGFRHVYQRTLDVRLHKAKFTDWDGVELEFPVNQDRNVAHGYVLRRLSRTRYELSTRGQPTMVFAGDLFREVLPLVAMRSETRELSFAYDDQGRLFEIGDRALADDRERQRYQLRYDAADRICAIEALDALEGPTVCFAASYSQAGELLQVRDAAQGLWVYEYDQAHRWTRQVDPRGYGYSFRYDQEGRCVFARGDDGLWTAEVEYFPDKRLTRLIEGEGACWEYHYDKDGFITKIVNPQGGERLRVRDFEGRILEETDPGGRKLTFLYDANGANYARRDRFGCLHPPESESPRLCDPFARALPSTPLARTFAGAITPRSEAMLGATEVLFELGPSLHELAQKLFRRRPAGQHGEPPQARRSVDLLGRPSYEIDGLHRIRRWTHDACGNQVAYIDRDGREYRREIISWNLLGARIDPLGNVVRYRYDKLEQMVELVDPAGNQTRWDYDHGQRLTRVWRHDRLRDVYEYDRGDHFVAKYDGDGALIFRNAEFHPNHFVARRVLASGGEHRFDYDARGRIVQASTQTHEIRLAYDHEGRRALDLRDGEGFERRGGPGQERLRLFRRFEWRCQRLADRSIRLTAPNGQRCRLRDGHDGVVLRECANGTREWLQYDHEGRLQARLTARRSREGATVGWGVRYAYSSEGDLLSVADTARGTTSYQVDAAHRLVGETTPTREQLRYEFDEADNLVHTPTLSRLALSSGNRVSASATELFEHDGRDRLAVRRHRDGPVARFHYDSFDMLEAIEFADDTPRDSEAEPRPPRRWRAGYDAIGRRLWTDLEGRRREFFWDGDRLAADIDPDGRLRIYLYADHDALVPLAFVDYPSRDADPASGRLYHVFCDGTGMPLQIEDSDQEIVWWADRVDPWGRITLHPSARLEYNLRWPGHVFDPETGLHYNRYRYYDPELGRYLTPDPIGYRGSPVNLYAYCFNPLVQVDVLGLHPLKTGGPGSRSSSSDVDGADRPPDIQRSVNDEVARLHDQGSSYSNGQRGRDTMVAGVLDKTTNSEFLATNSDGANLAREDMHPIIRDRVEAQDRIIQTTQALKADGLDISHMSDADLKQALADRGVPEQVHGMDTLDQLKATNDRVKYREAQLAGLDPARIFDDNDWAGLFGENGTHGEVVALNNALYAFEEHAQRPATAEDLSNFELYNQQIPKKPTTDINPSAMPRCACCRFNTAGVELHPSLGDAESPIYEG